MARLENWSRAQASDSQHRERSDTWACSVCLHGADVTVRGETSKLVKEFLND